MHIVQLVWEFSYNHETKFMNDVVSITTVIVQPKSQIYICIHICKGFKCVLTFEIGGGRTLWLLHE